MAFVALAPPLSDDMRPIEIVCVRFALGARRRASIMITAILCIFCFMTGGAVGFTVAAVLTNHKKAEQDGLAVTGYERSSSEPN
jgi:spore maturation protein SpmA